jgi:hypothetical protein
VLTPNEANLPYVSVPMAVDGTTVFVPEAWGTISNDDPRPWRNGVRARMQEKGMLKLPREPHITAMSAFDLDFVFEFPPPTRSIWDSLGPRQQVWNYGYDMVKLRYLPPDEASKVQIHSGIRIHHLKLLADLKLEDGIDVGNGWRMVSRKYEGPDPNRFFIGSTVYFRFDERDWQAQGGSLPRRVAVSVGSYGGSGWRHVSMLSPAGWSAHFETVAGGDWRERHMTVEALFDWLKTPPGERDALQRFPWWRYEGQRPIERSPP